MFWCNNGKLNNVIEYACSTRDIRVEFSRKISDYFVFKVFTLCKILKFILLILNMLRCEDGIMAVLVKESVW